MMDIKNYTLGRGKISFARFAPGTQRPDGFAYFGNTPEFNLTIESEVLDHFSSDEGIREKDDSIPLQVNRTGSLTTDNIAARNIALFFFGDDSLVTQVAATAQSETLEGIKLGHSYRLGMTTANPTGFFGIDTADLTLTTGAVPLVVDVDYTIKPEFGTITFLESSTVVTDGDDVDVDYSIKASTRERIISGTQPVEGALMYEATNPKGKLFHYYMPYVKISPNGDYALKSDEWQAIPFTLDIQKPNVGEAIYVDGAPAFS